MLKSGCRIEARQFGTLDQFVRVTALFAVSAWHILYATLLTRTDTQLCCEVLLQPVEWQALYCHAHRTKQLPEHVPNAAANHRVGKHDRPPGPTVIWRGFPVLHEITKMYQLFKQSGWHGFSTLLVKLSA